MTDRVIRSIQIGPDAVDIAYIGDGDVRAEGQIYQSHQISIARSAFEDLVSDLEEAANDLLQAGISKWGSTLPIDVLDMIRPDEDEDED